MKTAVAGPPLDPRQRLVDLLRIWENGRIINEWRQEHARIRLLQQQRWLAERRCIVCGRPVTAYDQYSRCYYAEPCGHRQGQGKAP